MEDKNLTCAECGEEFVFSADEQQFYMEKGFTEPKRCKPCRAKMKASRGGRRPREMHDVICADCGEATQVPFRPSEDKPVYCRDCYAKRR
ncbi:MAG: CxxC-x17-CxxC domain-containing protein [Candidatus Hydrothermarchaeaceae archaeon]